MSSMPSGSSFEFVSQEPSSGGFSAETKTRIRKQAMKAVSAARRRSGRHGQHNLLQYPPDVDADIDPEKLHVAHRSRSSSHSRSTSRGRASPSPRRIAKSMPASLPFTGMELVLQEYQIDPGNLETLAGFQVDSMALEMERFGLYEVNSFKLDHHQSYLPHAYIRYGQSTCLDDALICVLFKSQQQTLPTEEQNTTRIISLYNKAIASLNSALSDSQLITSPEVLCTTEMLALFELLSDGPSRVWSPHISGAFQLLKLRGPQGYSSEFEKTLFMSVMARVICPAFRANQRCWLEDENWQKTLNSIFSPEATNAAAIALIPTLSNEVTEVVCRNRNIPDNELSQLIARIRNVMRDLVAWCNKLQVAASLVDMESASDQDHIKSSENLNNSMVGVIILGRMLGAVSSEERDALEDQAITHAEEILNTWENLKVIGSGITYCPSERVILAQVVIDTTDNWRQGFHSGRLIGKETFESWCGKMGRSTD